MSPSGIVSCFIFTGCLMAGLAAGEWKTGAVVGVVAVIAFVLALGWGGK